MKISIGLEEYGYPKILLLDKGWVRISQGWFFWDDEDEDSYATYLDFYINKDGKVSVILSDPMIFFDFVTPLDDYLLPCSKTITVGDLHKELELNGRRDN